MYVPITTFLKHMMENSNDGIYQSWKKLLMGNIQQESQYKQNLQVMEFFFKLMQLLIKRGKQ